jgi:TRAP-type C4-dicarboxylate transport system permease small subunit
MSQAEGRKKEDWIDQLSYQADRLARFLVALMMAVMSSIILFGVFNRFIFKIPISWTEEIAKYLLIWISMLGSAVAVRIGAHVGVGLIVTKLKKSSRNIVSWVNQLTIVGFVVILIYLGMKVSLKELHTFGYSTRFHVLALLAIPVGVREPDSGLYILKMLFRASRPPGIKLMEGRFHDVAVLLSSACCSWPWYAYCVGRGEGLVAVAAGSIPFKSCPKYIRAWTVSPPVHPFFVFAGG